MSAERDAEIIRRRQDRQMPAQIAREMGVRSSIVANVLRIARDRGVEFPAGQIGRPPVDNSARNAPVLEAYRKGHGYHTIAKITGMKQGTVGTIIHRAANAGLITLRTPK